MADLDLTAIRERDRKTSDHVISDRSTAEVFRDRRALLAEVDRLRESNKALHRRCQQAEASLPDYRKIIATPPDGDGVRFVRGSLGRALAVSMCEKLGDELDATQQRIAELESAVNTALPGYYYMDPPDGGDVPLAEQLRRMAMDAARYRWLRDVAPNLGNRVPHVSQYPPASFDGHEYDAMQVHRVGMDAAIDAAIAAGNGHDSGRRE